MPKCHRVHIECEGQCEQGKLKNAGYNLILWLTRDNVTDISVDVGNIYRYIVWDIYRYILGYIYRYMIGYLQIQGIAESRYHYQHLLIDRYYKVKHNTNY